MGDFAQNGAIATLHDFGTRTTEELESELLQSSITFSKSHEKVKLT